MYVDFLTILSSLGVSLAGVWWLAQTLLTHQLTRHLDRHKAEVTKEIEREKTILAGEVRKEVESIVAERSALVEYEWEARKRLYTAIGPLRFQLLMACRDVTSRIHSYPHRRYLTHTSGYYGMSMVFTLMRPLVLSELIEQQVAYADFGVDSSAIDLLCFKKASYSAFTGAAAIADHPEANWNSQVQHLFYGTLNAAANALIIPEAGGDRRCMAFHECVERLQQGSVPALEPLRAILSDFSIESHPLFWARLVCFGFLCSRLVAKQGKLIGFEDRPYDPLELLRHAKDAWILERVDRFASNFERLAQAGL